jgi:hypothetical protein
MSHILADVSDTLERPKSQNASMRVTGIKMQQSSKEQNKMACRAKNGLALKEKWDAMIVDMMVTTKHDGIWHA